MLKMTLLLYLLPWLGCLPIILMFPMEDDGDPLIDRYRLQLEKKDISSPLKDSLLSALLMSEIHGEAQKQRKKAVDSTFIRFGRSSFPGSHRHPSQYSLSSSGDFNQFQQENSLPANGEGALDIVRNEMSSSGDKEEMTPEVIQTYNPSSSGSRNFQNTPPVNGCRLASSGDLVRALMGNTCNRRLQKVKRENVNDTFIRFGKREASRRLERRQAVEDAQQQHQET